MNGKLSCCKSALKTLCYLKQTQNCALILCTYFVSASWLIFWTSLFLSLYEGSSFFSLEFVARHEAAGKKTALQGVVLNLPVNAHTTLTKRKRANTRSFPCATTQMAIWLYICCPIVIILIRMTFISSTRLCTSLWEATSQARTMCKIFWMTCIIQCSDYPLYDTEWLEYEPRISDNCLEVLQYDEPRHPSAYEELYCMSEMER